MPSHRRKIRRLEGEIANLRECLLLRDTHIQVLRDLNRSQGTHLARLIDERNTRLTMEST